MAPEAASAEEVGTGEASGDQLPTEWLRLDMATKSPRRTCMRLCLMAGDTPLLSKPTALLPKGSCLSSSLGTLILLKCLPSNNLPRVEGDIS